MVQRGKVTGFGAGPKDGNGTVGECYDGRNAFAASQSDHLAQQVAMPLMHPVENADGDDGVSAGGGVGQNSAKVHSWLVPMAPHSTLPAIVTGMAGSSKQFFGETAGGKAAGRR